MERLVSKEENGKLVISEALLPGTGPGAHARFLKRHFSNALLLSFKMYKNPSMYREQCVSQYFVCANMTFPTK